ncbi:MAG: T9SS type A sorting domain-containing protein [Candidatus Marinimicrobia bacterium]|nr:T9SS type A sorting domain-containing protein [Candidatus Neomarinimicrobiota bacterium]
MRQILILIYLFLHIGFSQEYQVGDQLTLEHQNSPLPTCANSEGEIFLRDYNGNLNGGQYFVTMINTFTSWCTYCQQEIPPVNQLYEEQFENGFRVISFGRQWYAPYSCDEWAGLGATYPLIDDDSLMAWSWFGLGYVPQNIILDHNMVVRYSAVGYNHSEVESLVVQYLNELPSVSTASKNNLPERINISPIFPNPFNPVASLQLNLHKRTDVQLIVRDISGKKVDSNLYENMASGSHTIRWNSGYHSSGIYFFEISMENASQIRKGILIK